MKRIEEKEMISKIALVACSNPLSEKKQRELEQLIWILEKQGIIVKKSYLITGPSEPEERGAALMECYMDRQVQMIFDISGGDLCNGVLSYLDYDKIRKNPKPLAGYSDLTALINGIYAQTGNQGMLYQILNVAGSDRERQSQAFIDYLKEKNKSLCQPEVTMLKGDFPRGEKVLGGNIRCLLKLAGTPFWPDFRQKVLLLESQSGGRERIQAFLDQMEQMGIFDEISGMILGTFSQLDREEGPNAIEQMVWKILEHREIPIGRTMEIGHGQDSKGMILG